MSNQPQAFVATPLRGGNSHTLQNSHSGEFRNRAPAAISPTGAPNGHPPVPVPNARMGNGSQDNARQAFPGPRSPPNAKNTSHVPCKFYRQGACQAGKACPFLHSDAIEPCKYYRKGNCKFGMRCANEHITSEGRRINKPAHIQMVPGQFNLGGRVMPAQVPPATSSLLTMQHDHLAQPQPIPSSAPQDYMNAQGWNGMAPYDIPTIDTTFSSHPGSAYGSPQVDNQLALSPVAKSISLLDAPLPASFDSQGISVFARQGPMAASVPSRFGLDSSPPSSLPNTRAIDSSTLRNLHSSAFGDDSRSRKYTLGSSPSVAAEDTIGRRIMHSERFSSRPKMLSSSVGARRPLELNDEWEENFDFTFEEDLVPNSLLEILTPEERRRRLSRTADDENILSHRAALSGLGTPAESTSKVGSPSNASPSRFGALFARQQQQKATENSFNDASSAFGHVGSPLRPSALNPSSSPSLRAVSRPTSGDFSLSSPPRHASHMGMISQQLSRTRISSRGSDNPIDSANQGPSLQHPGISRVASGGSVGTPPNRLDRTASTSSVGVGREKIDEEPELFAMDEVGESKQNAWKRLSSGSGVWGGRGVGVIGSQRGPAGGI